MHIHHGKHAGTSKLTRKIKLALIPAAGAMAFGPLLIVHPGDTLSGIAQSAGVSLGSLERANPQIANPDLIYAGQKINLPGGAGTGATVGGTGGGSPHHAHHTTHHVSGNGGSSPARSSGSSSSSDLADVPGVPREFAKCVAFRESGNNPSSVNAVPGFEGMGGGAYGIMDYVWQGSDLNKTGQPYHASLAEQKQAFSTLYAKYGSQPWTPSDGCTGG